MRSRSGNITITAYSPSLPISCLQRFRRWLFHMHAIMSTPERKAQRQPITTDSSYYYSREKERQVIVLPFLAGPIYFSPIH
eukprot:scaffold17912_cov95-Skeletonema_marinoi.AAC.1